MVQVKEVVKIHQTFMRPSHKVIIYISGPVEWFEGIFLENSFLERFFSGEKIGRSGTVLYEGESRLFEIWSLVMTMVLDTGKSRNSVVNYQLDSNQSGCNWSIDVASLERY